MLEAMKRSQIIDIANRRTEKRAASLDLNAEFTFALQELCLYQRWWWRKVTLAFTIKAGVTSYRMDDNDAIPAPDFQQVVEDGVKIYANPTADPYRPNFTCLRPVFDVDEQAMILALQSMWPTGIPSRYFVQGGGPAQLVLDTIPDKDYVASLSYWAVPSFSFNTEDETVPLVPAALHSLLVKRLEMRLWGFALGEGSGPYSVAASEFEKLVEKASTYRSFADGERRSLASQDRFDAVQST